MDPPADPIGHGSEDPSIHGAAAVDRVLVIRVNETPATPADEKSPWLEWTKVVLLPLVTLLATVAGGYYFTTLTQNREARQSSLMKEREARESSDHLYAQLLTQREESDAQIRKDMFQVVIQQFLSAPKQEDLSNKVLQLELLASNFNQSLDLAPLFKDLARRLLQASGLTPGQAQALRKRLDLMAANLIVKQVDSLSRRGFVTEQQLPLAGWEKSFGKPFIDDSRPMSVLIPSTPSTPVGAADRIHFAVEVVDVDVERREVEVRLRVKFPGAGGQDVDRHFWVGQYDFPMLDNTQLAYGLRASVVVTDFFVPDTEKDREANTFVKFHLVVFPAASASFKERQDYDDILLDMLRTQGRRTPREGEPQS